MTRTTTLNLPIFEDYTLETSTDQDGTYVLQSYYNNDKIVCQAKIYYRVIDGEPLKWPIKFVFTDYDNVSTITSLQE